MSSSAIRKFSPTSHHSSGLHQRKETDDGYFRKGKQHSETKGAALIIASL
jgi:hypothetical protein